MWTDPATVEDAAMRQLRNVSSLPWIKGLAVMPDVHYGKGATVGSVIAMHGAVCPAAVGVDIGCGMSAVKTSLTAGDLPGDLSRLRSQDRSRPSRWAAAMHDDPVDPAGLHGFSAARLGRLLGAVRRARGGGADSRQDRAAKQMGTLGGGNHFVEVCLDTDDSVWLMLHSGSRNIGKELADLHIGEAAEAPAQPGPGRPRPRRLPRRTPRRWPPTAATCSGRRSTPSTTGRS